MKFTLLYDGPLPSAGNKPKPEYVWAIRKQFDPQLRKLWSVNQDLANLKRFSEVRTDGQYIQTHPHHEAQVSVAQSTAISSVIFQMSAELDPLGVLGANEVPEMTDLCAPITCGERSFLPLVRDSLALNCGLQIQFLREGSPGKVYQGGDLDGRIKLLLDALAVPQHSNQLCDDAESPNPMYCLLEDDGLATSLDVDTGELLSLAAGPDAVHLVINVNVRVARPRSYNQIFLSS